jgi:hypothetical protein
MIIVRNLSDEDYGSGFSTWHLVGIDAIDHWFAFALFVSLSTFSLLFNAVIISLKNNLNILQFFMAVLWRGRQHFNSNSFYKFVWHLQISYCCLLVTQVWRQKHFDILTIVKYLIAFFS